MILYRAIVTEIPKCLTNIPYVLELGRIYTVSPPIFEPFPIDMEMRAGYSYAVRICVRSPV
jgi:hypothetical protein